MAKLKPRYSVSRDDHQQFLAALKKALAKRDTLGTSALEHVAQALVKNAMMGKEASIAMIADRIDGRVTGDILGLGGPTQTFEAIFIRPVQPTLIDGSVVRPNEPTPKTTKTVN